MIENIDFTLVNWSRGQFAMIAFYHWLFIPITIGDDADEFILKIEIPKLLSFLGYKNMNAFVPGVNDLVYGNEQYQVLSAWRGGGQLFHGKQFSAQ